jgi:hypothetical protein
LRNKWCTHFYLAASGHGTPGECYIVDGSTCTVTTGTYDLYSRYDYKEPSLDTTSNGNTGACTHLATFNDFPLIVAECLAYTSEQCADTA